MGNRDQSGVRRSVHRSSPARLCEEVIEHRLVEPLDDDATASRDGALNLFLKETEFRINCETASAQLRTLKRWAKSDLPIREGPKF